MSFGGLFITNRGRALQAKAQTGVQLNFTKLAVGDGQLSGQSISDLTELIHQIKTLELNKFKTLPGGKAVVGGVLSNQDIVTGFYWRELGVFAQDPDLGEILYCYGNAGDLAEYIPAPGGAEILEKQVDVITLVGNASNVSASIEQSLVYITQGEKGEPGGVASLDDTGKVPAEQLPVLGPVTSVNSKTGDVVLSAEDVGAETPAGAEAKADAALAAANQYTDQEVGAVAQAQASHEAEKATDTTPPHGMDALVKGPTSAVSGNVPIFDGTTGKLIKDSGKKALALSDILVFGMYTGNDESERTINLGFTPRALLIMSRGSMVAYYNSSIGGGLAFEDSPAYNVSNNKNYKGFEIVSNGFKVYHDSDHKVYLNATNHGFYHYIAWR